MLLITKYSNAFGKSDIVLTPMASTPRCVSSFMRIVRASCPVCSRSARGYRDPGVGGSVLRLADSPPQGRIATPRARLLLPLQLHLVQLLLVLQPELRLRQLHFHRERLQLQSLFLQLVVFLGGSLVFLVFLWVGFEDLRRKFDKQTLSC